MTSPSIATMFDRIAPRYDALNHLLSFNIDKVWRRKVARKVSESHPQTILDVATGTADLSIVLAKHNPACHLVGLDIAEQMLEIGREKVKKHGLEAQIELMAGDAPSPPFQDNQFDAVTVAFGVRNFGELDKGLKEIRRVIKPGGALYILEFSMPTRFPMKQVYGFYLKKILPAIGKHVSKDPEAYRYLSDSVRCFPQPTVFDRQLTSTGLEEVFHEGMTMGIVTLYQAKTSAKQ